MAEALIERERLRGKNGVLFCRRCGVEGASFPSLACADCFAEVRANFEAQSKTIHRFGHRYEVSPVPDAVHRWGALLRNMATDQRLDREAAERLLRKSQDVLCPKGFDRAELQAAFNKRFGEQQTAKVIRPGAWADEAEND